MIRFCERGTAADSILVDARAGVLQVGVPVALVGPTAWHDVVFRFRGANLELFVDGVLVDEEWGYGPLHRFEPPFLVGAAWEQGRLRSGFHGQVDYVALWDRPLSDAEIASLSGGATAATQRALEILGPERPLPHYWRPRGYNAYAGDCMLLWDGSRLHLFYLFDRRHHTSKWNLGAHQYAHLSTTDLMEWQRHPPGDTAQPHLGVRHRHRRLHPPRRALLRVLHRLRRTLSVRGQAAFRQRRVPRRQRRRHPLPQGPGPGGSAPAPPAVPTARSSMTRRAAGFTC